MVEKDYFSEEIGTPQKDYFAEEMGVSPSRKEIPTTIPPKPLGVIGNYLQNAQPAFKYALTGNLENQDKPWAEIYRDTRFPGGASLPFAKSQSMVGQMVPQVLGGAIDLASKPSSYLGALATKLGTSTLLNNPATRRWMQIHTPNLAAPLLSSNPVKPIIKNINGMNVDITKPLPEESGKIAEIGRTIVGKINGLVEQSRSQYKSLLKPYNDLVVDSNKLSALPKTLQDELGAGEGGIKLGDLWEKRWVLKDQMSNPYAKAELLKKVNINDRQLMEGVQKIKAVVLNAMPKEGRDKILEFDPNFETIHESSRGLLRSLYNPETNKINTGALNNLFKKEPQQQGNQELFNKLKYFDNSLGTFQRQMQIHNRNQAMGKLAKRVVEHALIYGPIIGGAYALTRGHGGEDAGD